MPIMFELHMEHVISYLDSRNRRVNRDNEFIKDDAKYKDDNYELERKKEDEDKIIETKNRDIRIEDTSISREEKLLEIKENVIDKNLSLSVSMQSSFGIGIHLNS